MAGTALEDSRRATATRQRVMITHSWVAIRVLQANPGGQGAITVIAADASNGVSITCLLPAERRWHGMCITISGQWCRYSCLTFPVQCGHHQEPCTARARPPQVASWQQKRVCALKTERRPSRPLWRSRHRGYLTCSQESILDLPLFLRARASWASGPTSSAARRLICGCKRQVDLRREQRVHVVRRSPEGLCRRSLQINH